MQGIRYRPGYKYRLEDDYSVEVDVFPPADIETEYICLNRRGTLRIRHGYAWDGPSGPTVDTDNFMRGSLVHDALYQLMREDHLDRKKYREASDRELQKICLEDGMSAVRAQWVYWGVHYGGGPSTKGDGGKPILKAP